MLAITHWLYPVQHLQGHLQYPQGHGLVGHRQMQVHLHFYLSHELPWLGHPQLCPHLVLHLLHLQWIQISQASLMGLFLEDQDQAVSVLLEGPCLPTLKLVDAIEVFMHSPIENDSQTRYAIEGLAEIPPFLSLIMCMPLSLVLYFFNFFHYASECYSLHVCFSCLKNLICQLSFACVDNKS